MSAVMMRARGWGVFERRAWASTSPSQLSAFKLCARKWWRESVNGERRPSGPAAERGSLIHAQLEAYLERGGAGALAGDGTARAMVRALPPAASIPRAQIEVDFSFTPAGWPVPVRGRVDLVELAEVGGYARITDHKSVGSLSASQKGEYELRADPQALLYSHAALVGALGDLGPLGEPLTFRLVYGETAAPYRVAMSAVTWGAADLVEGVEALGEAARAQSVLAAAPAWGEVAPNYSACDRFGGCSFLRDCRAAAVAPVVEVQGLMSSSSVNPSDFLAALAARRSSTPAPAEPAARSTSAPPVVPAEPVEVAELAEPSDDDLLARYGRSPWEVDGEAYAGLNPPDGLPDGAEVEGPAPKRARVTYQGKALSTLKADEARAAVAERVAELSPALLAAYLAREPSGDTLAANKERLQLLADLSTGAILPSDEAPAPVSAEVDNLSFDDLLSGWGAPPPAPPAPVVAAPVVVAPVPPAPPVEVAPAPAPVAVVAAPAPVVAPVKAPAPAPSPVAPVAVAPPARLLLVDCHAAGAVEAEALIAPLIAELSRAHGAYLPSLDYAKGWAILGLAIAERGWSVFGGASIVRLDSSSMLWRHASFALVPLADLVVRG